MSGKLWDPADKDSYRGTIIKVFGKVHPDPLLSRPFIFATAVGRFIISFF